MGKDSLLKSTSKKKGAAKKKDEELATKPATKAPAKAKPKGAAKAKPKKAAAKKSDKKAMPAATAKTAKKAAPKTGKAVTAKKAAPKAPAKKKAAKAPAKKTAAKASVKKAAPKKKVTVKELLFEKFEGYAPVKPFEAAQTKRDPGAFQSPPFISAADPAEAARLKALLLEKLDLAVMAEVAREAAPAAAPEEVPAEPAAVPPPVEPAAPPPPRDPDDSDVLEGFGGPEPLGKPMVMGIVAFAMLVLLIVGASYSNTHKFYLKAKDGGVEIWQGAFAPLGQEKLVSLPGVEASEEIKDVYYKSEVFPMAFDYYVRQADVLLDAPGLPDFKGIKSHLNRARAFATTRESEKLVRIRIDYIDLFILRYKAEVSAAKGTVDGADAAVAYLQKAERLAADTEESEEIARRIESFRKLRAEIAAANVAAKIAEEEAQDKAKAAEKEAVTEKAEADAAVEKAQKADADAEKVAEKQAAPKPEASAGH